LLVAHVLESETDDWVREELGVALHERRPNLT
jgi:hypothetical protein